MVPIANPSSSSILQTLDQPPVGPPTANAIVSRLASVETGPGWVVSCYLKLEPRDRARGKYLIKLKNRIKNAQEWLEGRGVSRSDRQLVDGDLQRVYDYLENPANLPVGRGIAVFASTPRELFEAVPLPQVFRSRLAVDRGPLVRELTALDDEFGMVICVVYDRMKARYFMITAFGVEEIIGTLPGDVGRAGKFRAKGSTAAWGSIAGVMGEHNYNQRIRVEKHRHYATIAQRLFQMGRWTAIRGFVLAGVGTDAGAVEPHLHPYLREHVLGAARLNPKNVTPNEVMEAVLDVRSTKEREWEAAHIGQLEEGVGSRWAVNGMEASLRALARGQVRTLLVNPTLTAGGFRCRDTGRLTLTVEGCRGEGEAEAVPDVIDEAIEDALRQGSHVDVVEGDSSKVDGLAALLRFKQG